MGRRKGSKNKNSSAKLAANALSVEERVQLLASLIADTIAFQQHTQAAITKELAESEDE